MTAHNSNVQVKAIGRHSILNSRCIHTKVKRSVPFVPKSIVSSFLAHKIDKKGPVLAKFDVSCTEATTNGMNRKPIQFSTKLYGREEELQKLQSAIIEKDDESRIVLIGGYAGTGKSELVRHFQKAILNKRNEKVLTGKFDEMNHDPFSAVTSAFSQYFNDLLESPQDLERLREGIRAAVGCDQSLMTNFIPSLRDVLGVLPDTANPSRATETTVTSITFNRLRFVFAKLVAAIDPIALLLDDLHWADEASLQLLTTVVANRDVKSFFVLGTFRDNEVDEEHFLFQNMERLEQTGKRVEMMHLTNLTFESLQLFISDTLQQDETQGLAEAVYTKTRGNIYFTIQFLSSLHRKRILDYSYTAGQWEWDVHRLEKEMNLADNVVDLLVSKIRTLSKTLQGVLGTAALLRSSFDSSVLQAVLKGHEALDLELMLDKAVEEGLLEKTEGSATHRFSHDRVLQAAQETISMREELSFVVGQRLLEFYNNSDKKEQWMMFVAVDRLNDLSLRNSNIAKTMPDSLEMARMNLAVAEKAITVGAFVPASKYLDRAISVLKQGTVPWNSHYDLCLGVFTNAASVEFSLGNFDKGKELADEVLANASCVTDKIPIYRAVEYGFSSQERHAESLTTLEEGLKLLAERPHLRIVRGMLDLIRLRSALSSMTDEEIMLLPVLEDNSPKAAAIEFYTQLFIRSIYCGKKLVCLSSATRATSVTLKHGLSRSSSFAFVSYAVVLVRAFRDFKTARRLTSLSEKILKSRIPQRAVPTVTYITISVDAWSKPLVPELVNQCFDGYRTGMQRGEFEFALVCLSACAGLSYLAGLTLETSESYMIHAVDQCLLYNYKSLECVLKPMLELYQELIGSSKKPLMDWASSTKGAVVVPSSRAETLRATWGNICRMQVAYYYGALPLADQLRIQFLKTADSFPSLKVVSIGCFFSCLTSIGMAQESRETINRNKYRMSARKERARMKRLLKNMAMNYVHKYDLMDAEFSSTFHSHISREATKKKYDKAIAEATSCGFLNDAALGNELAGHFMERCKDEFWAAHYYTRAYELYLSWGAKAKASHLLQQHRECISTDDKHGSPDMQSTFRDRTSVIEGIFRMHRSVDLNDV